jgi:hypothetical protein
MKKILTILSALALGFMAFAQTDDFKPTAGKYTGEVNFSPIAGSSIVSIDYVRGRYFKSPNMAYRIGVNLGFSNSSPDTSLTINSFALDIRPGFEKHLAGTERLSPYFGAEAIIALKTISGDNNGTSFSGGSPGSSDQGYFRVGANAVAGFDYYIFKRVYLGVEAGYGFLFTSFSDKKYGSSTVDGGSTFNLGANFNGSLRLGYVIN